MAALSNSLESSCWRDVHNRPKPGSSSKRPNLEAQLPDPREVTARFLQARTARRMNELKAASTTALQTSNSNDTVIGISENTPATSPSVSDSEESHDLETTPPPSPRSPRSPFMQALQALTQKVFPWSRSESTASSVSEQSDTSQRQSVDSSPVASTPRVFSKLETTLSGSASCSSPVMTSKATNTNDTPITSPNHGSRLVAETDISVNLTSFPETVFAPSSKATNHPIDLLTSLLTPPMMSSEFASRASPVTPSKSEDDTSVKTPGLLEAATPDTELPQFKRVPHGHMMPPEVSRSATSSKKVKLKSTSVFSKGNLFIHDTSAEDIKRLYAEIELDELSMDTFGASGGLVDSCDKKTTTHIDYQRDTSQEEDFSSVMEQDEGLVDRSNIDMKDISSKEDPQIANINSSNNCLATLRKSGGKKNVADISTLSNEFVNSSDDSDIERAPKRRYKPDLRTNVQDDLFVKDQSPSVRKKSTKTTYKTDFKEEVDENGPEERRTRKRQRKEEAKPSESHTKYRRIGPRLQDKKRQRSDGPSANEPKAKRRRGSPPPTEETKATEDHIPINMISAEIEELQKCKRKADEQEDEGDEGFEEHQAKKHRGRKTRRVGKKEKSRKDQGKPALYHEIATMGADEVDDVFEAAGFCI